MKSEGNPLNRPSYEEARKLLVLPAGTELPPTAQEVQFDKPAPTAPPGRPDLKIPPWLMEVYGWIAGIVADEGVVMDICLDRATQIVQSVHDRGLVGIDHFPEAQGGMAPTRMNMVAVAAPLAVELYKQVLASINERKDEFATLLARAQELKKRAAEAERSCLKPEES